jgi:hypothetical protein
MEQTFLGNGAGWRWRRLDARVDVTSGGKRPLTPEQCELIQQNREAALERNKKMRIGGSTVRVATLFVVCHCVSCFCKSGC